MGTNGPLNTPGAAAGSQSSPTEDVRQPQPQPQPRSPRARTTVPYVDPWCDDGSLSRAEPPWLRDKRLKQQRDRLQQQKERMVLRTSNSKSPHTNTNHKNNPFDAQPISPASTNPFDSSSASYSYSESTHTSSSRPPPPPISGSAYGTHRRPVTPLEEKKEADGIMRRHYQQPQQSWDQVPPYQSSNSTKHPNPFDSSDSSTNDINPHYVNPFDTSGESSAPPLLTQSQPQSQQQQQQQQRPRIVRPSAKRPSPAMLKKNAQKRISMMYAASGAGAGVADESVGGQDSLDQFLDTTDETAASSSAKDPVSDDDDEEHDDEGEGEEQQYEQDRYLQHPQQQQQQQQPQRSLGPYYVSSGTYSSEGESISTTTPSERALQAAQSLRASFDRSKRRTTTPSSGEAGYGSTSVSGNGRQTPKTPVSSQTPPTAAHSTTTTNVVTPNSMMVLSPQTPTHPQQQYDAGQHSSMEPQTPKSPISPGESARPPATRRNILSSSPSVPRLPRTPEGFPSLMQSTTNKQARNNMSPRNNMEQEILSAATVDEKPMAGGESGEAQQPSQEGEEELNLSLHDLCDEARTTDDLAWRNALYLLSIQPELASQLEPECQMNVLHVCCMALDPQQPPPVWMIRALLYTDPQQCQQGDSGGRLPLHLLAATSGNVELMQLLVDEYPASVAHRDSRGFTPLHLLLKNDQVPLTLEHLRILLGQNSHSSPTNNAYAPSRKGSRISFRRGEHLKQSFQDLQDLQTKQQEKHEQLFDQYPEDVEQSLRKITQWKRRQVNRGLLLLHPLQTQNSNQLASVYHNPASIPTPTSRQWPLHLLVRRKHQLSAAELQNEIGSPKLASTETLIRVLIAAHPEALLETDTQGRTPLLTALLQSDSLPDVETVDLLLGKYTPGMCSDPNQSPARLASTDTLQLPLHVAAEELAHSFELLSTIAEAYPAAVQVQDVRGRTPLHCALENYRSVPVDEATFGLLLMSRNQKIEQVAKTLDADGKRPLDLIIEHPAALKRWSMDNDDGGDNDDDLLCAFLNASIDRPQNERQARNLLERIRTLPPWLRGAACASTHVQRTLLEELATPVNTALALLQGATLVSLLVALRIALEGTAGIEFDSWVLVNYFCAYHLATQVLYWGTALYLGEFYRMILSNGWRWIDLIAIYCSIATASLVQTDITSLRNTLAEFNNNSSNITEDSALSNFLSNFVPADEDALISALGAWATGLLWLSLVGFFVQWWCAMAVFVGSSVQIVRSLFWPLALAALGIVAMAQILKTLEDCVDGNICGLSDAYTTVYWMILGEPIIGLGDDVSSIFEKETSTNMIALLMFFTFMWLMWLVSVIATTVSEASRLDRHQIALYWFWEPKVALTVMARGGLNPNNKETLNEPITWTRRYCGFMERHWHILSSSIRGGGDPKQEVYYWDACCFRPGMVFLTQLLACIILPLWFWLGVATLGLLWPPQLRRWLFSTRIVDPKSKEKGVGGAMEERLTAAKLSHFKGEMEEYQTKSMDQNHAIQQDLAQIKELLFRAMAEEGGTSGFW